MSQVPGDGTPPPPTPSSEEALRAKLPAALDPLTLQHQDLVKGKMVLLRGGWDVSVTGGGLGGSLTSERYFLVLLDQAAAAPAVPLSLDFQVTYIRGRSIEVFLEGGHLFFDAEKSVHSRTESSMFRIPIAEDGSLSRATLAAIEPEHEKVWRVGKFDQVFNSTAPMSASESTAQLAYYQVTGRIRSLADAVAADPLRTRVTPPLQNPKPLMDLLYTSETSSRTDMMNLDAEKGRLKLEKTLRNALQPGHDYAQFKKHEMEDVEALMRRTFNLKSTFGDELQPTAQESEAVTSAWSAVADSATGQGARNKQKYVRESIREMESKVFRMKGPSSPLNSSKGTLGDIITEGRNENIVDFLPGVKNMSGVTEYVRSSLARLGQARSRDRSLAREANALIGTRDNVRELISEMGRMVSNVEMHPNRAPIVLSSLSTFTKGQYGVLPVGTAITSENAVQEIKRSIEGQQKILNSSEKIIKSIHSHVFRLAEQMDDYDDLIRLQLSFNKDRVSSYGVVGNEQDGGLLVSRPFTRKEARRSARYFEMDANTMINILDEYGEGSGGAEQTFQVSRSTIDRLSRATPKLAESLHRSLNTDVGRGDSSSLSNVLASAGAGDMPEAGFSYDGNEAEDQRGEISAGIRDAKSNAKYGERARAQQKRNARQSPGAVKVSETPKIVTLMAEQSRLQQQKALLAAKLEGYSFMTPGRAGVRGLTLTTLTVPGNGTYNVGGQEIPYLFDGSTPAGPARTLSQERLQYSGFQDVTNLRVKTAYALSSLNYEFGRLKKEGDLLRVNAWTNQLQDMMQTGRSIYRVLQNPSEGQSLQGYAQHLITNGLKEQTWAMQGTDPNRAVSLETQAGELASHFKDVVEDLFEKFKQSKTQELQEAGNHGLLDVTWTSPRPVLYSPDFHWWRKKPLSGGIPYLSGYPIDAVRRRRVPDSERILEHAKPKIAAMHAAEAAFRHIQQNPDVFPASPGLQPYQPAPADPAGTYRLTNAARGGTRSSQVSREQMLDRYQGEQARTTDALNRINSEIELVSKGLRVGELRTDPKGRLVLGGRAVHMAGIRNVGNPELEPEKFQFGEQRPLGRSGDVYEFESVSATEVLEEWRNRGAVPGNVTITQSGRAFTPEQFSKENLRLSESGQVWQGALGSMSEPDVRSGQVNVSARLIPGVGKSGTVSVSKAFLEGLYSAPTREDPYDEYYHVRMEERFPGLPILPSELRKISRNKNREATLTKRVGSGFDVQGLLRFADDMPDALTGKVPRLSLNNLEVSKHPFAELQTALLGFAPTSELLKTGERIPGNDWHNWALQQVGSDPTLQKGLRKITAASRRLSDAHLRGHTFDPIALMQGAGSLTSVASSQLSLRRRGQKFAEGAEPTVLDVVRWAPDSLLTSSSAENPSDFARILTDTFFQKRGWKSRDDDSLDHSTGMEVRTKDGDIVERQLSGDVNISSPAPSASIADSAPGERTYSSVRDFFGSLSAYEHDTADNSAGPLKDMLRTIKAGVTPKTRMAGIFGFSYDPDQGIPSITPLSAKKYRELYNERQKRVALGDKAGEVRGTRFLEPGDLSAIYQKTQKANSSVVRTLGRRIGLNLPEDASYYALRNPSNASSGDYYEKVFGLVASGTIPASEEDRLPPAIADLLTYLGRTPGIRAVEGNFGTEHEHELNEVDKYLQNPSIRLDPIKAGEHKVSSGNLPRAVSLDDLDAMLPMLQQAGAVFQQTYTMEGATHTFEYKNGEILLDGVIHQGNLSAALDKNGNPQATGVAVRAHADAVTRAVNVAHNQNPEIPVGISSRPLYGVLSTEGVMPLSPQLADTEVGSAEAFGDFLTKVQEGTVRVVGLDIETGTKYRLDGEGKPIPKGKPLPNGKTEFLKETTGLRSVGIKEYFLGTDAAGFQSRGGENFETASGEFIRERKRTKGVIVTPTHKLSDAQFGMNSADRQVSLTFDRLSSYDADTYFTAFNASFDVKNMSRYAREARNNARLYLLHVEADMESEKLARAQAQLKHFEEAERFFTEIMPGRTIEAANVLEVGRAARNNSKLEEYMRIYKHAQAQTHTALSDLEHMFSAMGEALGDALKSGPLFVEKMKDVFVFPYKMDGRKFIEQGREKIQRLKTAFQLTGVVPKSVNDDDALFQLYGRAIDKSGTPIGPERQMATMNQAGQVQLELTQQPMDWRAFDIVEGKKNLPAYWDKALSDTNLRDLIERNVRRAIGYQGADKTKTDFWERDSYVARGKIVEKYESRSGDEAAKYLSNIGHALLARDDDTMQMAGNFSELDSLRVDGKIDDRLADQVFDWLGSKEYQQGTNPGFQDPAHRYVIKRTGQILQERAEGRDALLMETFHVAGQEGRLSPEAVRHGASALSSLIESAFPAERVVGPEGRDLPINLVTIRNDQAAIAHLTKSMSKKEVFDTLFDYGTQIESELKESAYEMNESRREAGALLSDAKRLRAVANKAVESYDDYLPSITGLPPDLPDASEESKLSRKEQIGEGLRLKANRDTSELLALQAEESANAAENEFSQATSNITGDAEGISRALARALQPSVSRAFPTLEHLGKSENFNALAPLADAVYDAIQNSNPRGLIDDLDTSMPVDRNGQQATKEVMYQRIKNIIGRDLDGSEDSVDRVVQAASEVRRNLVSVSHANDLTQLPKADLGGLGSDLRERLRDVATSSTPAFRTQLDTPLPGEEEFEHMESRMDAFGRAATRESEEEMSARILQKASATSSNLWGRVGTGVAIAAGVGLLAAAVDNGLNARESRRSEAGRPGHTHEHDAGHLDTELNQNSEANEEGNQGWETLDIDVTASHPGFPGSSDRLDSRAINAFSADISAELGRHFQATPSHSQSESRSQNERTRWQAGNLLRRAYGRYGS